MYSTEGRGKLYSDILGTVGDTPCVRLNRTGPDHVTMYVKVEAFNPLSSVKDRLALNMIEAAEREGRLSPGQTVVEATSGNTGIGLAMVCAAKGYPLVITMAESFSIERRRLMRFLGAQVVLTPKEERGIGMYKAAQTLAEQNGWFFARQFETSANADIHEATTGREILADFKDARLDYWVTGYGTGGTVTGVARVLRNERPECRIVLSEPHNARLLGSGLAQERHDDDSPAGSHPAWEPHVIQGWTPDFIPKVLQEGIDRAFFDEVRPVDGVKGMAMAQHLAANEGILTGVSGGSTLLTAVEVANQAPEGSVLLVMLPDTGERYLSTPLFESIPAEMNDEEMALFASTRET
ncbi:pyridoxal-phosphate dependent enzyme [Pseudomonadales bacterium]|nr:pyridoxal-phosphate dependent enzyme [Pseudomonadales bacterium]MDC1016818.1 pyridoxal-phosphate dependent enzyme [Pseudomonadales bacterium]MDC3358347.1 pyridoxal-phosphate dependent enzyme [Pseudomonadales bacterium]